MGIKGIFSSIWNFLKGKKAEEIGKKIISLSELALPIVKAIAAMTPTRADDEIVKLFEKYGLPNVEKYLSVPPEDRGYLLLMAGSKELGRQVPGVPSNIINSAVQIAVTAMKASEGK